MLDQIQQNSSDRIEIDVFYNNALTNPTSITINYIRDPLGNLILTNLTPTQGDSTGRYYYNISSTYTSELGTYQAEWQFVIGNSTFKHLQEFEVVSVIRDGYVVPKEVRDTSLYSEITDTLPTDAVLQKYINRATTIMDAYFGSSINYAQHSDKIRCVLDKAHNGVHIQLRHRPLVSLTSVQLIQGPTNTLDLDVDYIRTNDEAAYLEYFQDIAVPTLRICIFDPSATNIIPVATVSYTAGYCVIPEAVKTAATMIVEQLYRQTKGDDKQLVRFTIEEITEAYKTSKAEEDAMTELGISGSRSIVKLLRPYVQPFRRFGFAGPLG